MSKDFLALSKDRSHRTYISPQLQLQGHWVTDDSSAEEREGLCDELACPAPIPTDFTLRNQNTPPGFRLHPG